MRGGEQFECGAPTVEGEFEIVFLNFGKEAIGGGETAG